MSVRVSIKRGPCGRKNSSGAVFLEFALVLPILVGMFVGFLDITRYYFIAVVLQHGAEQGLFMAQSLSAFERTDDGSVLRDGGELYLVRKRIIEESLAVPEVVRRFIPGKGASDAFLQFSHVYGLGDPPIVEEPLRGLVLLPGESAVEVVWIEEPSSVPGSPKEKRAVWRRWVDHPFVCASYSESCGHPRELWSKVPEHTFSNLERLYPVVVQLSLPFSFILPGIPDTVVSGTAVGYRERYPKLPTEKTRGRW